MCFPTRWLLLLTLLCNVNASEQPSEKEVSKVFRLNEADFDDTVKEGFWLLEFFAVFSYFVFPFISLQAPPPPPPVNM
jgi:hypothetical protein